MITVRCSVPHSTRRPGDPSISNSIHSTTVLIPHLTCYLDLWWQVVFLILTNHIVKDRHGNAVKAVGALAISWQSPYVSSYVNQSHFPTETCQSSWCSCYLFTSWQESAAAIFLCRILPALSTVSSIMAGACRTRWWIRWCRWTCFANHLWGQKWVGKKG